ncbi:hypothetical protein [Streptomyces sp. NPDC014733]|uniref:DUF7927 domain-containing protein n=1 Tax=Streptomyces sp. NPDC014733 TaxID=3364885 RepID=UPI0036F8E536
MVGPVMAVLAVVPAQGAGAHGHGGQAKVSVRAFPSLMTSRAGGDHGSKGGALAGSVITYSVVLNNPGGEPLADYHWEDDLTKVLDGAVGAGKGGDLLITVASDPKGAEVPRPTLNGQKIQWTGDVPARTKLTFTYRVRVKDPLTGGDHHLINAVTAKDSNCAVGSTDAKCRTDITARDPAVRMTNTASVKDGAHLKPGDEVTYTVTAKNRTRATKDARTWSVDLKDVVDDAEFLPDSITARRGDDPGVTPKPVYSGTAGSEKIAWTGDVPADATLTFTFRVRILNPGSRPRSNGKLFDVVQQADTNCPAGTTNPVCRTPKDPTDPPIVVGPSVDISKTGVISP